MPTKCEASCPECQGRGEVVLLTSTVRCSRLKKPGVIVDLPLTDGGKASLLIAKELDLRVKPNLKEGMSHKRGMFPMMPGQGGLVSRQSCPFDFSNCGPQHEALMPRARSRHTEECGHQPRDGEKTYTVEVSDLTSAHLTVFIMVPERIQRQLEIMIAYGAGLPKQLALLRHGIEEVEYRGTAHFVVDGDKPPCDPGFAEMLRRKFERLGDGDFERELNGSWMPGQPMDLRGPVGADARYKQHVRDAFGRRRHNPKGLVDLDPFASPEAARDTVLGLFDQGARIKEIRQDMANPHTGQRRTVTLTIELPD